jgi:CopG family transcriptional regulator, nickel-responsive regulator
MQRITLSIDDDLAATLDRHMKKHRYTSRSEALRDILRDAEARERLTEDHSHGTGKPGDDAFCIATLAYVYDHETRELGRRITESQHRHHDLQVATMHVHLDHDSCLEVAVLRGSATEVRALADETISQRGVRHGQLHLVPAVQKTGKHAHGKARHEHVHIKA